MVTQVGRDESLPVVLDSATVFLRELMAYSMRLCLLSRIPTAQAAPSLTTAQELEICRYPGISIPLPGILTVILTFLVDESRHMGLISTTSRRVTARPRPLQLVLQADCNLDQE